MDEWRIHGAMGGRSDATTMSGAQRAWSESDIRENV